MKRTELDAIRARADEHHRIPTVMAADRRDLLDYVDKLLAVIERCASECAECGGSGAVEVSVTRVEPGCCGKFHRGDGSCCGNAVPVPVIDVGQQPCPDCADIREVLPG